MKNKQGIVNRVEFLRVILARCRKFYG